MVKFINNLTACVMYVDESRKEEYIKAGHKLAIDVPSEKKTTTRKRSTKKD